MCFPACTRRSPPPSPSPNELPIPKVPHMTAQIKFATHTVSRSLSEPSPNTTNPCTVTRARLKFQTTDHAVACRPNMCAPIKPCMRTKSCYSAVSSRTEGGPNTTPPSLMRADTLSERQCPSPSTPSDLGVQGLPCAGFATLVYHSTRCEAASRCTGKGQVHGKLPGA